MALDKFIDFIRGEDEEKPNKITKYIGDAIKKAREENGYSQTELAEITYLRRATLSNIENGNSEPNASTLLLLAHVLHKPVAYFLPYYLYEKQKEETLTPLEKEMLMQFRDICDDTLRDVAIKQVKQLADFDQKELIIHNVDLVEAVLENFEERTKYIHEHKKNKFQLD